MAKVRHKDGQNQDALSALTPPCTPWLIKLVLRALSLPCHDEQGQSCNSITSRCVQLQWPSAVIASRNGKLGRSEECGLKHPESQEGITFSADCLMHGSALGWLLLCSLAFSRS